MPFKKGVVPKRRRRPPQELTPLQERFVDEYVKDLKLTEAAARAGCASAAVASNMLRLAHVKAEVDRRKRVRAERAGIGADRTLVELSRIAYSDIGDVLDWKTVRHTDADGKVREETVLRIKDLKDLSPAARASISEIKPTKHGLHVKFHDKKGALDTLAKHLGLLNDTVELKIPVQFIVERSSDRRPDDAAQPAIEGEVIR